MPSLTDLIRHLPTGARIKRRKRIEMIADHWALFLRAKYGDRAAVVCRDKMIRHAKVGRESLRWHVWCRVWRQLRNS